MRGEDALQDADSLAEGTRGGIRQIEHDVRDLAPTLVRLAARDDRANVLKVPLPAPEPQLAVEGDGRERLEEARGRSDDLAAARPQPLSVELRPPSVELLAD